MPAVLLNQYRLFHHKNRPVGAAVGAFLSPKAKLSVNPLRPKPDVWKSDGICWEIDLIAPGANEGTSAPASC